VATGFGKKTTSACGAAGGVVVRLRDLSDIATPDFLGEAVECDSTNLFKFELLQVGTVAATEMDSGSIC